MEYIYYIQEDDVLFVKHTTYHRYPKLVKHPLVSQA